MQSLRHARLLARLVLVWFALSIGVAIASPMVNPKAVELICSGGAMKLLVKGDDGSAQPAGHSLDCPLCATMSAPPPAAAAQAPLPSGLSHTLLTIPQARIAALTAAPPPGRGPPVSLPI
ncbi:MAG: DUF2946 family protein [Burkholderiales bacterium]|nr:DUF2946 family protein [Burkholderiales bacterium]